jgi:hypothetical protein
MSDNISKNEEISDESLISMGFYFVQKDPFTGKSAWYYVYDPWKKEVISNRDGEWRIVKSAVTTEEELKNFIDTF